MKTSTELSDEILDSIDRKIKTLNTRIANDPHDGRAKNERDELLSQFEDERQRIKEVESQKRIKKESKTKSSISQQAEIPEQSKSENNLITESLHTEEEKERLLLRMTLDKLIHTINNGLNENIHVSDLKDLSNTPSCKSFAFWYCKNQANIYFDIWIKIGKIEFYSFSDDLRAMSDQLTERNEMIRDILPEGDFNTLSNRIKTLELYQALLENEIINLPNNPQTMRQLKSNLRGHVKCIVNELKDIAERAAQYNEN